MALASRTDLQEYCLRRLGAPVIEINVDEQQVSDRVDDALQFWNEYHFDGTEKTYVKHEVTGSKLKLTTNIAERGLKELRHSKPVRGSNITPVVIDAATGQLVKNDNPFSSKSIVITGSFNNIARSQLKEELIRVGARVSSSVSSKTEYLIAGEKPGSKLKKATDLQITILDEEEALKLLNS